jgi:hypothetical protein
MVKIIKLASGGLAPTMRTGRNERSPAVWGVEVNGALVAHIFTQFGESIVVDAASGRCLYQTVYAPRLRGQSRVALAKEWAINNF